HHAACSGGGAMKDTGDPIPLGMISIRDAVEAVYRAITANWQALQERLNPASPYYDTLPRQDAKCEREQTWRNYDNTQQRAIRRYLGQIRQGGLVALLRDPKTGDILQLDRDKWAWLSDFEVEITTIVSGAQQPVFFDRKEFDKVVAKIAPLTVIDTAPVP